jgi:hypothetical protein
MHAGVHMKVTFANSCKAVQTEMLGRVTGGTAAKPWTDPHNGGHYSCINTCKIGSARFMLKRKTGGQGRYTDKIDLSFKPSGTKCEVTACSESQVTSYKDFSTNFCNIRNLYCGPGDKCPTVGPVLTFSERVTKTLAGSTTDKNACIAGGGH